MSDEDKPNKFNKAWVWIVVAIVVLIIIGVSSGQSSNNQNTQSTNQSQEQTATSNQQPQQESISLSQVPISHEYVTCEFPEEVWPNCYADGDSDYDFTAEVTNNSSQPIDGIDLTVDLYDCPGKTIDSTCTHIGQDKNADLTVSGSGGLYSVFQPGITTEATAYLFFEGVPPIQNNILINDTITGFEILKGKAQVTQ